MSNLGKWATWYADLDEPEPYGLTATYQLGADFLAPCETVEDWGSGRGWMRRHIPEGHYVAVDGTETAFTDVVADLTTYTSSVAGIYMRHVLEHNYEWSKVLANACASFTERLVLVLFTPLADETHELAFVPDPGVPDLAFALTDIAAHLAPFDWRHDVLESETAYGVETIFYVSRGQVA